MLVILREPCQKLENGRWENRYQSREILALVLFVDHFSWLQWKPSLLEAWLRVFALRWTVNASSISNYCSVFGLHDGWKLVCIFLVLFEDHYREKHRKVKVIFWQNWCTRRRFSVISHMPKCYVWRQAVNKINISSQRVPETCQRIISDNIIRE